MGGTIAQAGHAAFMCLWREARPDSTACTIYDAHSLHNGTLFTKTRGLKGYDACSTHHAQKGCYATTATRKEDCYIGSRRCDPAVGA